MEKLSIKYKIELLETLQVIIDEREKQGRVCFLCNELQDILDTKFENLNLASSYKAIERLFPEFFAELKRCTKIKKYNMKPGLEMPGWLGGKKSNVYRRIFLADYIKKLSKKLP